MKRAENDKNTYHQKHSTWHAWDGMHGTRILISLCDQQFCCVAGLLLIGNFRIQFHTYCIRSLEWQIVATNDTQRTASTNSQVDQKFEIKKDTANTLTRKQEPQRGSQRTWICYHTWGQLKPGRVFRHVVYFVCQSYSQLYTKLGKANKRASKLKQICETNCKQTQTKNTTADVAPLRLWARITLALKTKRKRKDKLALFEGSGTCVQGGY